jgi:hypothetical protein
VPIPGDDFQAFCQLRVSGIKHGLILPSYLKHVKRLQALKQGQQSKVSKARSAKQGRLNPIK